MGSLRVVFCQRQLRVNCSGPIERTASDVSRTDTEHVIAHLNPAALITASGDMPLVSGRYNNLLSYRGHIKWIRTVLVQGGRQPRGIDLSIAAFIISAGVERSTFIT